MKGSFALFLAIILCLTLFCMLTGCKDNGNPEVPDTLPPETDAPETDAPVGPVTGGWTPWQESVSPTLPEEAKAAFDLAMEQYDGAKPIPVAFLGSQVVAGVNYSFLCAVPDTSERDSMPVAGLKEIRIYRDLEGNASILNEREINIAAYTNTGDVVFPEPALAGGWGAGNASGAALPDDVQKAFDTATAGLTGVGYEPIAVLGTQVVAGTNYAILCKATQITAEPTSALAVLTIYADLDGGATLTSVCGF